MSKQNIGLLMENPETTMRNQLNNSRSKMQYTFSQSSRFEGKAMSASPGKYYDLPSLWSKKGTSIGRSNRTDFSKKNVMTPSPNKYAMDSSFIKKKTQGISMGLGRQYIKYRNMFNQRLKKSPDSASYKPTVPYNTKSYSIAQRLDNNDNKWLKQVPGPGNYAVMELTNNRNKKILSKYLSANSMEFGKSNRGELANKTNAPGPGQYEVKSENFDQSLFDKPYASKFGTGERRGLSDQSFATPGPGSYTAFSQFLK